MRGGQIVHAEAGEPAKRGTRIHKLGEQFVNWLLQGKNIDAFENGDAEEIREAREYARQCIRERDDLLQIYDTVMCGVEAKCDLVSDLCWGTADFWAVVPRKHLLVLDLKTGREAVNPKDNSQLIIYAADLVREHRPETIELCIWQPNAPDGEGARRSHVYTRGEFEKIVARIIDGVQLAGEWLDAEDGHESALVAGDHCKWCDALGVCPKVRDRNLMMSREKFTPISPPNADVMSAEEVAQVLERASMFRAWLDAVQTRALTLLMRGVPVPGYKAVHKVTRRVWRDGTGPGKVARTLGLDPRVVIKKDLLTPAKVEALLPREERKKLAKLVFKPQGLPCVVRETDRRSPATAQADFKPILNLEYDDE